MHPYKHRGVKPDDPNHAEFEAMRKIAAFYEEMKLPYYYQLAPPNVSSKSGVTAHGSDVDVVFLLLDEKESYIGQIYGKPTLHPQILDLIGIRTSLTNVACRVTSQVSLSLFSGVAQFANQMGYKWLRVVQPIGPLPRLMGSMGFEKDESTDAWTHAGTWFGNVDVVFEKIQEKKVSVDLKIMATLPKLAVSLPEKTRREFATAVAAKYRTTTETAEHFVTDFLNRMPLTLKWSPTIYDFREWNDLQQRFEDLGKGAKGAKAQTQ